ncbi:MAG TPA: branched-chain amino acid transport system II carrier protein [Rhabdochlamydiaceae bacterium]|nr:branched-chain amino acid transport system II carrier protein [Rhabdochlamydiaceae bacterium]HSX13111.1 branched-chain amino acid transport system II carrier protein [Chlamydiales bacterium]
MSNQKRSSVLSAGLALFSMFFGAGDLIWPLILGGSAGDKNVFAMLGLLITGVSLPLVGLLSMMLFQGKYREFFGRIGKIPGMILILIIQVILGPIGTIPRLFALSYATLKPYLPAISLSFFSVLACLVVLAFAIKKRRIIDILGFILTPILLLSLGAIVVLGLMHLPVQPVSDLTSGAAFTSGLKVGYNTLDLIASFIFAPLVLSHFCDEGEAEQSPEARKQIFKKMLKACLIATALLSAMYVGLTYVASYYAHLLPAHLPEERLAAISRYLLGPQGAFISCIAVAMACLTTAIPVVSICAEYIKKDLLKDRCSTLVSLLVTLAISGLIANLGFTGIANMLSPILQILCPGLIVLSVLNIANKMYNVRLAKAPVFTAFAISTIGYLL